MQPMKIIIAPDSFKESLTALEAARAIQAGFSQVFPDAHYLLVPMADGGEGTVTAMVDATKGRFIDCHVTGPLGQSVQARYGLLGQRDIAVIEMAEASGLHHVAANQRNPTLTTSYGTGELILDAIKRGVRHIILGLGGSATNDGGAGMLQALGAKLLDIDGQALPAGGLALQQLAQLDLSALHPALAHCRIDVACDVDNPLCGIRGASQVFGPQKGATPAMIPQLDKALGQLASVVAAQFPDRAHMQLLPGAGAAGGMGYALVSLLGAQLLPGVELVINAVNLRAAVNGADLVITGEGRIDGQTVYGKTPMGVLNVAKQNAVPCIALAGSLGQDADAIVQQGMQAVIPIMPAPMPLTQALVQARENLTRTAASCAALLKLGQR